MQLERRCNIPTVKAGPGNETASTLGGLFALLLWSTTVATARSLSEALGPITAAILATGTGGVVSLLAARAQGLRASAMLHLPRKYLLGCGALFALYMACIYAAIGWAPNRSSALLVGLINYLWPALTVVLSIPILKNRSSWWILPGCLAALGGAAAAILGDKGFSLLELRQTGRQLVAPLALAAVAAVAWALYSNLARRWGRATLGAVPLFLLASAAVLLPARIASNEQSVWTLRSVLELLFIATGPMATAYVLWERGMRRGNHLLLALVSYFMPIASIALAAAYLRVRPGANLLAGCVLVAAGAVICKMSIREPDANRPRGPIDRTHK